MPIVYLIEGPVGAGKSTYSMTLALRTHGVHIALDEWFASLFSPDRPPTDVMQWYMDRKARLIEHIWKHSKTILASGTDVILELGLVQRNQRIEFCRKLRDEGHAPVVHALDAPFDIRQERVRQRNVLQGATFSMVVPDHVFEMASGLWETPDEMECSEFDIEFFDSSGELPEVHK